MPGAVAHLGECRRGRCPPPPRSSPHCTPAPKSQPSPCSGAQVEFPSCRLAQPLGFFLTRQQFYVRHHSTCPPPCLSSYFCSPSWWDLWPSCPLTPQSGLLLAPPMDQATPNSSASDGLRGPSPFQAASLWCLSRPLLVVPRHCTVLSTT